MWLEFLRIGFGALRAHKFRAALTVLSITIGAFSIVLMSSLARSGIETLAKGIEDTGGSRFVAFFPKAPGKGEGKGKVASYSRGLVPSDAEALRGRVPHVRHFAADVGFGDQDIAFGAASKRADVLGGNSDFHGAYNLPLAAGRAVDDDDIAGHRRVAVLGHGVATVLFSTPEEALGRAVRVGTESYRVIGVAAKVRRFMFRLWFDWNDFVVVPLTAAPRAAEGAGGHRVLLVTDDKRWNESVERVAAAILAARHRGVDDFESFDFAVEIERFYGVFRIMQIIVSCIAGIALLVGGIGVMNILLVSVSERVREIGVRKALGAPGTAIGAQFLFESALLSGLGGLLGAGLGVLAALGTGAWLASREEAWVQALAPDAIVAALVLSVVIGIVFGLVPARRAGRLQVVDCLRAAG